MSAGEVREAESRNAAILLGSDLASTQAAIGNALKDPGLAAESLDSAELAEFAAMIQDMRAKLSDVEAALVTELGRRDGKTVGYLPDGRQFTVSRMADRKEWQHDDWKRDVRRVVVDQFLQRAGLAAVVPIADPSTGEVGEFPLAAWAQEMLATAQEVHGSTAPRTSTGLKPLGLFATDYCTSTPGGWKLTAVKPTEKDNADD